MFDEVPSQPPRTDDPRSLRQIREALNGLDHGRVTVVVQDGRIVQLERTDKVRLLRTGK
jgi:hypothetical protein